MFLAVVALNSECAPPRPPGVECSCTVQTGPIDFDSLAPQWGVTIWDKDRLPLSDEHVHSDALLASWHVADEASRTRFLFAPIPRDGVPCSRCGVDIWA